MLSLGNKLSLTTQPIYHFVNKYSIDFDGVDDCIVTDGADTVAQPTTYSFWCKSSTTAENQGVFGHGGRQIGAFHINFLTYNLPILNLGTDYYRLWNDTSAQDDGEWHHWVLYSDTNDITNSKLYVDGVLQTVSSTVSSGSLNAYTESLTIGGSQAVGGDYFEGKIDEFAVFDRELTQAEITRMYNTYYSPNRVANGNFSQIGNEEVTNGDFSQEGSELVASGNFSSFYVQSGDVTITNGTASFVDGGTNPNSRVSLGGLTANKIYKVVFSVTRYVAGNIEMIFGGGNTFIVDISAGVGTYTAYIVAGSSTTAQIKRNGGYPNFDFDLTSISIKEVGEGFTFGDGWGMGDDLAECDGTQTNVTNLSANTGNTTTAGSFYKITYTISNYSAGTVRVNLGAWGTYRSADDTYTEYIQDTGGGSRIVLQGNTDFVGSIDNISVKEVGQHWTFGDGWTPDQENSKATKSGSATSVIETNPSFSAISGKTYKVQVVVSDVTTGNFRIDAPLGDGVTKTASENFNYTIVAASSGYFRITGWNGFDGSVSNVVVQELKHDATNLMLNAGAYQSANPLITSTKSMEFDGTDDYLTSGDVLDVTTNDFSISFWFRWETGVDDYSGMVSKKSGSWAGSVGYAIIFRGSTEKRIYTYLEDGSSSTTNFDTYVFDENKWYNITVVFDRSDKSHFYINGVQNSEIDISSVNGDLSNTEPFLIGKNSTAYFGGNITEVGLYDRALTSLEVASLYNQGMPTNLLVNRNNYQSGNPTVFNTKQVDFDGTDDYLEIGNNIDFNAKDFSVSAWYKTTDSVFRIIQTRNTGGVGTKAGWQISSLTGNDWDNTIIEDAEGDYMAFTNSSMTNLDDGNWHHIVVTWNTSTGTGNLYADGLLLDTVTKSSMINGNINTTDSLIIGGANSGSQMLNGEVSQAGIWHSVLTANEVSSLYNHGLPIDLSTDQAAYESSSNLVGYWRMGSGTLDTYPLIADQTNATLGSELVVNGDFSQIGSELVTNGDFATGSDWNFVGDGSISNGELILPCCIFNNRTSQNIGMSSSKSYKLEINITEITSGDTIDYLQGGVWYTFGTQLGINTAYITNPLDSYLYLRNSNGVGTIKIDNASVKEVGQGWEQLSSSITISGDSANYDGSIATSNMRQTPTTVANKVYKITYTISNYTQGTATVRLDGNYGTYRTEDGTYTDYITVSGTSSTLQLYGLSNFIGSFDNISIKQVNGNPAIMTNQTSSDIENGSPYANIVQNGTFDTDSDWSYNASYWSISGGTANALGVANGGFSQTLSVTSGNTYEIKISSTITSGNGIYSVSLGTNQQIFDNNTSEITTSLVASGDNVTITIHPGASAFSMSSVTVEEVNTGLQGYWKMGDGTNDEYPVIYDQTNPTNGSELVTNGDFSDGSTGWENAYGGEWVISGGKATIAVGADGSYLRTVSNILTSGKSYKAVITTSGGLDANNTVTIYADSNTNQKAESDGTHTFYFTADGTSFRFRGVANDRPISIDSVSVKEIQGNPAVMTNMVEGNITNQYPLTKIRNYYRMGDGILDGYPIIQDQTSPNLAHIPTTNLVTYSEDFSQSYWTKYNTTIDTNNTNSPIGTLTADKITSSGAYANINHTFTKDTSAITYTQSAFIKTSGYTDLLNFIAYGSSSGNRSQVTFDLSDFTIDTDASVTGSFTNASATITSYANDWYRITLTYTTDTSNEIRPHIQFETAMNTNFVWLWGAQLEEQSQATAYIKSDGIAAVRKATTTNLISYSEDFSNYTLGNATVQKSNATSPDGKQNSYKLIPDTVNTQHQITSPNITISGSTGDVHTFSVYVKADGYGHAILTTSVFANYNSWIYVAANLNTGVITANNQPSSIESVGNGWYRISVAAALVQNSTIDKLTIKTSDNPNNTSQGPSFAGNGTSGILVYGAQFEEQTQAETYAKTTGLPVTIDLFTENNYGTMTNMSASDIIEDTPNN